MSRTIRHRDGDIYHNVAGRSEILEGADKAIQDLAEILMTPLVNGYGSELATLDIPPQVSLFAGKALISKKIDEAVQRLRVLQQQDPNAGPDERISKISQLLVKEINSNDFVFFVSVELEDGTISPTKILSVSLRHQQSVVNQKSVQELLFKGQ